jgi:hypothetical protein
MAKSIVRRKHWYQQFAIAGVVATTLLAITASGLKAMDDNTYGSLHTFSLVIMVFAYIFYLATLARTREEKTVSIELSTDGHAFVLSPCDPEQIAHVYSKRNDTGKLKELRRLPLESRRGIRAVVARNTAIDIGFVRLLASFPRVVALDIQDCQIDPMVWDELVHFDELRLILAHGSIEPNELRELAFTMPEIKIFLEPSCLNTN